MGEQCDLSGGVFAHKIGFRICFCFESTFIDFQMAMGHQNVPKSDFQSQFLMSKIKKINLELISE